MLIHIGLALLYEFYRKIPKLLEIIACVKNLIPFEAKPLNIPLNSLNIFSILLLRVGVIHTEIAHAAIFTRHAKVDCYRLSMSDVQISIGFWRKACLNLLSILSLFKILHNLFFYEVKRRLFHIFACGIYKFFCTHYV